MALRLWILKSAPASTWKEPVWGCLVGWHLSRHPTSGSSPGSIPIYGSRRILAMNEMVQFLERHDSWLLIAAVLGRQACLPIPANLLLVAAGALARSGKLSFAEAIFLSTT